MHDFEKNILIFALKERFSLLVRFLKQSENFLSAQPSADTFMELKMRLLVPITTEEVQYANTKNGLFCHYPILTATVRPKDIELEIKMILSGCYMTYCKLGIINALRCPVKREQSEFDSISSLFKELAQKELNQFLDAEIAKLSHGNHEPFAQKIS